MRIKSVEQAIELFELHSLKQYSTFDTGDYKAGNKSHDIAMDCINYLNEHHALESLRPFLKHEHPYVREFAAAVLLSVFQEECEDVLTELVKGNYRFASLSAEWVLREWNEGKYVSPFPTEQPTEKATTSTNKSDCAAEKEEEVFPQETNNAEETTISKDFSPEILRLSQIFKCPPTDNCDLRNEESGFYVEINPGRQELIININTFVNPYTQDVESVYKMRVERFKIFENVATISAENPSKYGFMKILITIPEKEAADDLLIQIKDAIDWNFSEWKPNECKVYCKAEYKGAECYFEGSWWYVWRAVIKNRKGYERYDFSDELKFDEEMWDLESGEYDDLENTDSFCLISPSEFESIWDKTTRIHKPVPN